MKIRQLISYTAKLLKGRRIRTGLICMMPLCSEVFFRLAEAAVYSLLLYFGELEPFELFSGGCSVQLAAALVLTLLRWVVTAPLLCAAAYRLCEICSEKQSFAPFSEILLSRTFFRRSLGALMWTKLIGTLALAPAVFFGFAAYSMFQEKLGTNGTFIAANAVVLTAVSLIFHVSLKLSFSAVPYLLVKFPQRSAFRNVLYSIKFMSGRKNILLRLAAVYLLPTLSIIGLPFALTRTMTAFSLSLDIFIREDEYRERIENNSGNGNSHNSSALPHRKKRRIKAAADKA